MNNPLLGIVVFMAAIVMLTLMAVFLRFWRLWLKALLAGAQVPFAVLLGMRLRGVNPAAIVDAYIAAKHGGVDVAPAQLESPHLAGGDVHNLGLGLVVAHAANIPLDFDRARSLDHEGPDEPGVVRHGAPEQPPQKRAVTSKGR